MSVCFVIYEPADFFVGPCAIEILNILTGKSRFGLIIGMADYLKRPLAQICHCRAEPDVPCP